MLLGSGGAGKSTLARQLGKILDIEVTHLDKLYWKPGWDSIERWELKIEIEKILRRESWIIDGNYSDSIDIRLKDADTVIFLDFSRALCFFRVFKRMIIYAGGGRPDLPPGCPEDFDWNFMKWIWNYPIKQKPTILKKLEKYSKGRRIFIFKTPYEVKKFLSEFNN